jgi:hypothetical protein
VERALDELQVAGRGVLVLVRDRGSVCDRSGVRGHKLASCSENAREPVRVENARLRGDLDSLAESLAARPLSFDELCSGIERSLEADGIDDPLEAIAAYSSQSTYLTKLSKFVQEVPKNALEWIEFNLVNDNYFR